MGAPLLPPSNPIGQFYRRWQNYHRPRIVLSSYAILLGVMLFLIPVDFLFFGNEAIRYTPFRAGMVISLLSGGLLLKSISARTRNSFPTLMSILLTVQVLGMYLYFMSITLPEHHLIVQLAIIMVMFGIHRLTYQLVTEHYLTSGAFVSIIASGFYFNFYDILLMSHLQVWNIACFGYFWFERRAFAYNLFTQRSFLVKQFPERIAERIMMADENLPSELEPRMRPCVCLSVDWRSFQSMTSLISAPNLAKAIAESHNILLEFVKESSPDDCFYTEWIADEFFVTLYSRQDDPVEVVAKTHKLLQLIAKKFVPFTQERKIPIQPSIDVGASLGMGLVGLIGPESMAKLTVSGPVGGIAKRLQDEAKLFRIEHSLEADNITFAINSELMNYLRAQAPEAGKQFTCIEAKVKNLEGQQIYVANHLDLQKSPLIAA